MTLRGPACATIAALGVLPAAAVAQRPAAFSMVPQRDLMRSGTDPTSASLSADGRFVAFSSYERLAAADTDARSDVYVLDRSSGHVTLVSETVDGAPITSDCLHPRISGDGRYVVFEATFARANRDQIGPDVVLHDRVEGVSRRITGSVSGGLADGWSASPSISADGRFVAFASTATDLTREADANGALSDVYLLDTVSRVIRRISVGSDGVQLPTGASVSPSISADGHYVAFTSTSRLGVRSREESVPRGATRQRTSYVYGRDLELGVTTRIAGRSEPDGSSMSPAVSGDGKFVAFTSNATNLVSGDRNHASDVFLYERGNGAITLVSRAVNGRSANGTSSNPAISADGRFVAFQSNASDLTCGTRCPPASEDINLLPDVFVFDRQTRTVERVSTNTDSSWMEESVAPALDAAGDAIAFISRHPIDEQDVAHDFDLFVRTLPLR